MLFSDKMGFFLTEATDDCLLQFSEEEDDESEKAADEMDNFIDDSPIEEEFLSYYRGNNPLDVKDYPRFHGQTRNPVFSDCKSYFGDNEQPELFAPENREQVTFDRFEGYQQAASIFSKTLVNLSKTKNYLFNSVIYGLMYYKSDRCKQLAGTTLGKNDTLKALGDDLYFDLLKIESETILDKTLFGFFERCYVINKF